MIYGQSTLPLTRSTYNTVTKVPISIDYKIPNLFDPFIQIITQLTLWRQITCKIIHGRYSDTRNVYNRELKDCCYVFLFIVSLKCLNVRIEESHKQVPLYQWSPLTLNSF